MSDFGGGGGFSYRAFVSDIQSTFLHLIGQIWPSVQTAVVANNDYLITIIFIAFHFAGEEPKPRKIILFPKCPG